MSFTRVIEGDDTFAVVHGSSWLGWFCLVLCGGLGGLALYGATVVEGEPAAVLGVLGVGSVVLGAAVFSMGYTALIDRKSNRVRTGWSVFGLWRSTSTPLDAFQAVAVRAGSTPTSSSGSHVPRYSVHLVGMTNERVRVAYLGEYGDATSAREFAGSVVRFTGLPVVQE